MWIGVLAIVNDTILVPCVKQNICNAFGDMAPIDELHRHSCFTLTWSEYGNILINGRKDGIIDVKKNNNYKKTHLTTGMVMYFVAWCFWDNKARHMAAIVGVTVPAISYIYIYIYTYIYIHWPLLV